MNDEILTIPELKILISQEEEAIRVKRQSLKYHEDLLKDLRQRLNNYVVDGLRLQVREFIELGAKLSDSAVLLKRHKPGAPKMPPGVICSFIISDNPYLEISYGNLGYPESRTLELEEEEAGILSSQAGRQAYNIDCSIWDTYRYPGEID